MKTKFSYLYLHKKYKGITGVTAWGAAYAAQLQEKHGVPFSHHRGAGEVYIFNATYNEETPLVNDRAVLETILSKTKHERYPVSFGLLQKETGLPLLTLLGACKFLIENKFALAGYDKNRAVNSIRWYPGQCRAYGASETVKQAQSYLDLLEKTRLVRATSARNLRGA